jgi:uncharacterized protein
LTPLRSLPKDGTVPSTNPDLLPVPTTDRIANMDVLRGFAVLGILVMNIQSYAMVHAAYFFPTAYGDLTGPNYWVWFLSNLLANQKFMTIFSMLFGAGIVLMHERVTARGQGLAGLHYRRMAYLLLFGLIHAYLLWEGDILVAYALCGLFVFLLRRLRPSNLLLAGLLMLAIGSSLSCLAGWSSQYWSAEALQEFRHDFLPSPEAIADELANWRSGWRGEFAERVPTSIEMHVVVFPFYMLWRAGGCMLLGMALFKWGLLKGQASRRTYWWLIGLALGIGLPLTAWGGYRRSLDGWEPVHSFFHATQYGWWASLLIALGWISGIMLLCRSRRWPQLTARLAATGRMAFTNYILQTVICTTLFYGHGFGLIGKVPRIGQAGILVVIWVLQLHLSPLWLRYFRFGPLEWLWRSLSYRKWQALRR